MVSIGGFFSKHLCAVDRGGPHPLKKGPGGSVIPSVSNSDVVRVAKSENSKGAFVTPLLMASMDIGH